MPAPAYTFGAVGTAFNGTSGAAGAPAGVVAGNLLLMPCSCRNNGDAFSAPTGWTEIHPHVNVTFASLFARIATGDAGDNPPTVASSGSNQIIVQIARFGGSVWASGLGSLVDSSIDKSTSAQTSILYDQLNAPTNANDLIIAMGQHNKTTTGNGATVGAFTGLTDIAQTVPNGSSMEFWWGYQQQTAAAIVASGGLTQSISIAESLQYASLIVALKTQPNTGSVAPAAYLLDALNL